MIRRVVAMLAALALLVPTAAVAAPNQEAAHDYVIVLLNDPPIASYEGGINGLERTKPVRGKLDPSSSAYRAYQDHLAGQRANYRDWLARNAPAAAVLAEFDTVLNAIAVQRNGVTAERLSRGPGVRVVVASWLYQPTMNVSVEVIEATVVWPALGGQANAGDGIKVGILDTGIDDSHVFFACKGDIEAKVYASGVAFDPDNTIVFDHGTHVAGTVAGCVMDLPADDPVDGSISGVAPGAELFDYNVFPGYGAGFVAFGGSAFSHDIIRALEDAVDDGMDVVNLSLGGGVQGPHDTLAEAINATADAGVVPAVAAGNSGPGAGTIGSPGNAEGALTAGASTNPHFIGIPGSATPAGGTTFQFGAALGDFDTFGDVDDVGYTQTAPLDGCSAISTRLDDLIAVIDRGTCSFTTKIRNAEDAGAVGVLVANNVAGDPVAMGHDGTDPFPTIPAAMVSKDVGAALGSSGTVSIDGTTASEITTKSVDIIAGFSSRGPGPFLNNIKPDFTAPGVNVYSSVFDNEFAMFQGTSMATPHVAGAAALLLHLHGGQGSLSPAEVKSLLGNSAKRPVFDHVNGTDPTGVMTRGGGRIDLSTASTATTVFDPMSVGLGLHTGRGQVSETVTVTVTNLGSGTQTYTIEIDGEALGMTVSSTTLDLAAGESGSFTVSLSVHGAATAAYEGDIVLTDATGRAYRLPFWYAVGQ